MATYQLQDELNEHNQNIGELMSYINIVGPFYVLSANLDFFSEEEFKQMSAKGWVPIFEDMTNYERELVKNYSAVLSLIEGDN